MSSPPPTSLAPIPVTEPATAAATVPVTSAANTPSATEVGPAATDASAPSDEQAGGTTPPQTAPIEGTLVWEVTSGDLVLEIQEVDNTTTFVARDQNDNVVFFKNFDNADPAFDDMFEYSEDRSLESTFVVLKDDEGAEIMRVSLLEVLNARGAQE